MDYLHYAYEKVFGADTSADGKSPRKVVCFGNVLLDRVVKLEDPELLERYELKLGSKGEMELEKLNKIVTEASNGSSDICNPGGSALNTVRILKLLGTDAQFFGAIGGDKNGEQLSSIIQERGIAARLETIEDAPTGLCACFMHNENPTLYANIGASAHFSVQFLKDAALNKTQSFLRPIERKQILYIEGFFLPQRKEVCDYILSDLVQKRRHLAVNLSAPYIVREQSEMMLQLVNRALFIFGNRQEFEELAAVANCESVDQFARQLLDAGGAKIMLITNGESGVQLITNYVAEQSPPGPHRFEDYKAQRAEPLIDTTGAGDSFVAGFLHCWLKKCSLSECVRLATDVAAKVVTQSGCNLP